MEFKPFEHKLVAILNEKIDPGRIMNALAHMSIGLGASIEPKSNLRLQDYQDATSTTHPSISDIPFIILKANSNQIRSIRKQVIENNWQSTDFTSTMIQDTYIEQHERTNTTKEEELEYFGICIFGDWMAVSQLTKKFSLWR